MFIATSWELRLLIKKFKFYWFPIIQLFLKLYRFDITLYINRINIFPRVITLKIYAYICNILFFYFKKDCIYLFLERGGGREKERERNINVWLPLTCPLQGTLPATQACALTGNRSSDPLVGRPVLNPLSHTSQGSNVL